MNVILQIENNEFLTYIGCNIEHNIEHMINDIFHYEWNTFFSLFDLEP